MRYSIVGTVVLAFGALGGCQSIEQAGEAQAVSVCTEGGYGPGTPYHDYCVSQLKPMAMQLEQQRRATMIRNGAALIASGLDHHDPKVTCIQQGPMTRCY